MLGTFKSEIRKLLTVRSTYVIAGIAVALIVLFAFYAGGYRATAVQLLDKHYLESQVEQAVITVGLLGSIVAVLLVTHEYRYNTIMYTLTASRSRTNNFLAKLLAISVFSIVFALIMGFLSPVLTLAGMAMHGQHLVPQALPVAGLLWKTALVGWGYGMYAFILAMVLRVQVGAIAGLFLIPFMLEGILTLVFKVLKWNAAYLPYNALQSILGGGMEHVGLTAAVCAVMLYIAGGWLVAWQLFLRRDAQ